jgi:hypothetical protein
VAASALIGDTSARGEVQGAGAVVGAVFAGVIGAGRPAGGARQADLEALGVGEDTARGLVALADGVDRDAFGARREPGEAPTVAAPVELRLREIGRSRYSAASWWPPGSSSRRSS